VTVMKAIMVCVTTDHLSVLKFEVRLTGYSRDERKDTHRKAVFIRCTLIAVHGLSSSDNDRNTQLQVNRKHSP